MVRKLEHVAVTPDGNRRWGKLHGISTLAAYKKGFAKVREFVDWTSRETKQMTFWALSTENFLKRTRLELRVLFGLMDKEVRQALSSKEWLDRDTRVRFFGKLGLLPAPLVVRLRNLEEETRDCKTQTLNIGLAYGGREELLQAAQKMALELKANEIKSLNEKDFEKFLYLRESPDLVIRTGGVQRLSGFLPWQAGYSEIHFSPKLWPEFTKRDYDRAVNFFKESEARYGR